VPTASALPSPAQRLLPDGSVCGLNIGALGNCVSAARVFRRRPRGVQRRQHAEDALPFDSAFAGTSFREGRESLPRLNEDCPGRLAEEEGAMGGRPPPALL